MHNIYYLMYNNYYLNGEESEREFRLCQERYKSNSSSYLAKFKHYSTVVKMHVCSSGNNRLEGTCLAIEWRKES